MKLGKIIAILALPYLILGCCRYLEPVEMTYSICSLNLENIDNSKQEIELSQSDTLPKQAYGIHLILSLKEGNVCKAPVSIFNTAYASKCDYEERFVYNPYNNIRSINITTTNSFDATHPAGDTVSEYFYEYDGKKYSPLDEHGSIITEHLLQNTFEPALELDFLLLTPPSQSGQHSFTVRIELEDGKIITATTKSIYLL